MFAKVGSDEEKQASWLVRCVFSVAMVVRLENNDLICPDTDGLIEMWQLLETLYYSFWKMMFLMTVCFAKDFPWTESLLLQSRLMNICLLKGFECQWLELNLWLCGRFVLCVEGLLSSFLHSPSTISWEIASVTPCSFLSFILISPVSFLWHLLRSSRLWLPHFSTFTLVSLSSSSPSLYHWILMGSWPTNCILNMAFCPALTFTAWVKTLRSSALNLGGS